MSILSDNSVDTYVDILRKSLDSIKRMDAVDKLVESLFLAWTEERTVYLCGNGGSAANAIHIANDFIFGAGKKSGQGLRVDALSANSAILTCLGNDLGYEYIYSDQIKVMGKSGDILLALSGSGNSANIVNAIKMANSLDMETFAILGFSGGQCKDVVKHPIHFEVYDMQAAEDLQVIVGHICMKLLSK